MQPLEAVNDKRTFFTLGQMRAINSESVSGILVVTPKDGNGGSLFYCQRHHFVYPIHGVCQECQNQVVEQAAEVNATACSTP
jgi:hypothetical protein